MNKLRTTGIYFKQNNIQDTGLYDYDNYGSLVHKPYKKPTFWERAKYFAKYGEEMNLDTNVTSIIYVDPFENNKLWKSIYVGDAITLAKSFKKDPYRGIECEFIWHKELLFTFQTETTQFTIEVQDDGHYLNVNVLNKESKAEKMEIYTFLDWKKI